MDDLEGRLGDIERRVRALEDKDEIAALAVRYGEVVDSHDAEALRALFTDDARFHSANGVMDGQGIDAVMQVLAGRWDVIKTSLHVSHGHVVELNDTDPNRATGTVFSHAEVVRNATPMISALRYDDVYRRVEGRWLFAERKLSFFYYVDAATYIDDLMSDTPVRADATPRPADLGPRRDR